MVGHTKRAARDLVAQEFALGSRNGGPRSRRDAGRRLARLPQLARRYVDHLGRPSQRVQRRFGVGVGFGCEPLGQGYGVAHGVLGAVEELAGGEGRLDAHQYWS
ncbi:hypothetical protein PG990_000057 [Apiospora arundinis]